VGCLKLDQIAVRAEDILPSIIRYSWKQSTRPRYRVLRFGKRAKLYL
jgi:hypothetical protein